MRCTKCREEIDGYCDGCIRRFKDGETIICVPRTIDVIETYHFCKNCIREGKAEAKEG